MPNPHTRVHRKRKSPHTLDRAIAETRAYLRAEQQHKAVVTRKARIAPAYRWARKVKLPMRGRARDTLMALVWLCANDPENGAERWRSEPRIASIAKKTGQGERTVKRHLAGFEDAGLIFRVGIPGRKRTRGQSCYAVYLCVDGLEAAECAAENDGLWKPQTPANDDVQSAPDGATLAPVLVEVFHTSSWETLRLSAEVPWRTESPPCSAWDRIPVTPSPCGEDAPVTGFDERNPPPLLADYGPSCPGEPCDGWRMCA